MKEETIAAIATSSAPGAIGIVRVSGAKAHEIAKKIFSGKIEAKKISWGKVLDQEKNCVDEVVCLYFAAPRSYTGEDVIELQGHGGVSVQRVLKTVLAAGARLAQPGEFTRRAFLNGKLDLTQAEAIQQLITAQSEQAARLAQAGLSGALKQILDQCKQVLIEVLASLCVGLDYPEEDLSLDSHEIKKQIDKLKQVICKLKALLETSETSGKLREGISCVLFGKPNVGKSSLMNALLGYDRAIVTEQAGTTRDTVTESLEFPELPFLLQISDTAGLRDTQEVLEELGIERTRMLMKTSDVLLWVCDGSEEIQEEERELIKELELSRVILVQNKSDLGTTMVAPEGMRAVRVSAKQKTGLAELKTSIQMLIQGRAFSPEEAVLSTQRQVEAAQHAEQSITEALQLLKEKKALDLVITCLEFGLDALMSLTGERVSELVIHEIFSHFCLGK